MKKLKLTRERQERFLKALAETGIVSAAVEIAGFSRTRVYELRKRDRGFSAGWEEAEERAADALEAEWVSSGVEPPASRIPRVADGTQVHADRSVEPGESGCRIAGDNTPNCDRCARCQ